MTFPTSSPPYFSLLLSPSRSLYLSLSPYFTFLFLFHSLALCIVLCSSLILSLCLHLSAFPSLRFSISFYSMVPYTFSYPSFPSLFSNSLSVFQCVCVTNIKLFFTAFQQLFLFRESRQGKHGTYGWFS